jgi:predicted nucleic acid-binding protein
MQNRLPIRAYIDTCIFGGACDQEFTLTTRTFLTQVKDGRFSLIVSALVEEELIEAPSEVRAIYEEMLPYAVTVYPTAEALALQQAYLVAGILTPKWADDALHVALATVNQCSMIVSWNFRHIVHFEKIPRYNAVNTLQGYPTIAIYTPAEVIGYEEDV